MAQPKGKTGNPYGRPAGAPNKVTQTFKTLMQNELDEHFFEKLHTEIDSCEKPYERARLRMEFIKLVVPRPAEEKEDEKAQVAQDRVMKALFRVPEDSE